MSLDVYLKSTVYDANITHNCARMAREAGIYQCIWRPDEIGIERAGQLIAPLAAGLSLMRTDPGWFRDLEAENGWGTYEQFVAWIEKYLLACNENPGAAVSVVR